MSNAEPRITARLRAAFPGFELKADLDLPARGVTALFGPSGAGKSTLLRCIAGLERTPGAVVRVAGERWQEGDHFVPVHRRRLGFLFQEPRLFGHLDVEGNLRFGQRRATGQPAPRWQRVVELLGLEALLGRRVRNLSLGERQRVAIGRALLSAPRLLLMDEPLASLDPGRKEELLPFIRRLREELALPILYVSHALDEILQIADHLVVLERGRVRACGPLEQVCGDPAAGRHLGALAGAVIETRVAGHDERFALTRLAFPGGELLVPRQPLPEGAPLRLQVLARNVGIALERPAASSILNVLEGRVTEIGAAAPGEATVLVRLDIGVPLLAAISARSLHELGLRPGMAVFALVKAVSLGAA